MEQFRIEIATTDFPTTQSAVEGGAHRIELCANLAEGGTTPSFGMLKNCREKFQVELYPMIRPRGGDFLYTEEEFKLMLDDAKLCKQLGCDGIVTGFLNRDGSIDVQRTSKIVEAVYPLGVTFHRAFDRCRDPFQAMEQLIEIGCERILTSGQKPNALDGAPLIGKLNEKADHRIIIMPGAGVNVETIGRIREITGCVEFHASLRTTRKSEMEFVHAEFAGSNESYTNNAIDPDEVRRLISQLVN